MRSLILGLLLTGCATAPADLLELMDASGDEDVVDAVDECTASLLSGRLAVRMAAAKTLGRLRTPRPEAIAGLEAVVTLPGERPELRSMAAWALGEMRSPASLEPLVKALRTPLDPTTGHYVLEGLAKHYAVMSTEESRLVEIVEAMVYFAGNQKTELSGVYDVLGARLRTVAVNVRVLERAVDAVRERRTKEQMAEVYTAAFELLARVGLTKDEIAAGPAQWKTRVEESVVNSQAAYALKDPRTELLVVWYLGKLADLQEIGRPAAAALFGDGSIEGRPTRSPSPAVRLVAAWAIGRMLLSATGPKRALERDILPNERHPAVLELLGGASRGKGHLDLLQKVHGAN